MSNLVFTYDGADLTQGVPATKVSVPQRAELGSISMGSVSIEDPAGDLFTRGHRPIAIAELDCIQPRLFTGWLVERNYRRSFEQTQLAGPNARIQDATIVDLNAAFAFQIITGTDGDRPDETIADRVAWILGSDYLSDLMEDTGKVATLWTSMMDATDYRGEFPGDVLSDCSNRTGGVLNYFAFWDDSPSSGVARPGLFWNRLDVSFGTACTISISNDLADINGTTIFGPNTEARLERTPAEVYSDVVVEYNGGRVFRYAASTASLFIRRGTKISRPHTGQESTANSQGDAFLQEHGMEADRIFVTLRVPSSVVGLIQAGQKMLVKFTHFPDYYADFTYMRIVACDPQPVDKLASEYNVVLELTGPRPEQQQDT